jgi:hypothetical protein
MNQVKNLQKLSPLSYFDKATLSQFIALSDNSLYSNIKRWLKSGDLIALKKGLYVTRDYLNSLKTTKAYSEFIANKLKEPSYLSMEYVLQWHNILTEAVFGWTSITLKSKRIYVNPLGTFVYRNIKEALFTGFEIRSSDGFDIRIARKAKALFDYLYFKLFSIQIITPEILDSFRLNLDGFSKEDLKEFSGYCKLSGIQKFNQLPTQIGKL